MMAHRSDREGTGHDAGLKEEGERRAEELGTQAKEKAEELRAGAEEKARDLGSKARHKMDEVGEAAGRTVADGASRAGERLRSVAGALRAASDTLDEEGEGWLAQYARERASQVDDMSGYLGESDASRMVSDIEEKARANPAAFLGGTLATGFVLGRFLRSSSRRSETGEAHASGDAHAFVEAHASGVAQRPTSRERDAETVAPPAMPPAGRSPAFPHERRRRRGGALPPGVTERRDPARQYQAGAP